MIKVSVLVPVYNVEKYLEKCLDSIINQSLKEIEILLIDDGSTDKSGKICDDYAKKDNRIVVIHQENQGVSAARNRGIELAKGEYISFVDSDDLVDEKMLVVLYDKGEKYNLDLVMCDLTKDRFGKIIKKEFELKRNEIIEKNNIIDFIKSYKNLFTVNHIYAKIYKRSFLTENNIYFPVGLNLQEDTVFVLETMIKANNLYCIKESYYNHIKRENSLTTKKYRKDIHIYYNSAYLTVLDLYNKNNIKYLENELYDRIVLQMIMCMFNINNSGLSAKEKESIFKEIVDLEMVNDTFQKVKIKDFPFDAFYKSSKSLNILSKIKLLCQKKYFAYKFKLLKNKNYKLLSILK